MLSPGNRADRIGDLIHRTVAEKLLREIKDPRLQKVIVSEVELSRDLKHAKIYFQLPAEERGNGKLVTQLLTKASGVFRQALSTLALRGIPNLAFHYDDGPHKAAHIEQLLMQGTPS